jgi:tetratricopeptide (TPR) repeat protein
VSYRLARNARSIVTLALAGAACIVFSAAESARAGGEAIQAPPGESTTDIAEVWEKAVALETEAFTLDQTDPGMARDRMARAALLFERIGQHEAANPPGLGKTLGYWRASRATWLTGELLPLDATEGRLEAFHASLELSNRGLAIDSECAACMLWKFISYGRLRTTAGVWEGMRQVEEMADLLDRGIALKPTYRDQTDNSTLGNLHYSSAIFYRILPDWFWIKWVLGVKGDKQRALEHSRKALALHPSRLDYQIELGTQLLCIGSTRDDHRTLREGKVAMRAAIARGGANSDDLREIQFAKIMLEEPDRSCGYSGDKLLDMDEDKARESSG